MSKICGIDYGSKMAGTTVFASYDYEEGCIVEFSQSEKKKDADYFLRKHIEAFQPDYVFIDAPLSLPLVYRAPNTAKPDFFYRAGDRELAAMSPLFLGGLTARAMRLQYDLSDFRFFETYPAAQAKRLELKALNYKKSLSEVGNVYQKLLEVFPSLALPNSPQNWHQIDALLALIAGIRFCKEQAQIFGTVEEGQIYV